MARKQRARKRLLLLLGLTTLLAIGGMSAIFVRSHLRARDAAQARVEGMAAYEAGDYEAALSRLGVSLAYDRVDSEAMIAYADARSHVERPNARHIIDAIGLYQEVLDRDPDNIEALKGQLEQYLRIREARRIELIDVAQQVLAQEPEHLDALNGLVWAYAADQDYETALAHAARVIEVDPSSYEARSMLIGLMQLADRSPEEMIAVCDAWIESGDAIDGRANLLKARVLLTNGETEAGLGELATAVEKGVDQDIFDDLLQLLDATGQAEKAQELIEATKASSNHAPWIYEVAIRRHWEHARLDRAIAELEDGLANSPTPGDRTFLRWNALLATLRDAPARARDAITALEQSIDPTAETADADEAWVVALRTRLSADTAPIRETIAGYQQALELAPNDALLHFLAGEAYFEAGETELAVNAYQNALRLSPNWLRASTELVEALLRVGRSNDAYTLARRNVDSFRTASGAWAALTRAWIAVLQEYGQTPGGQLPMRWAAPHLLAAELYRSSEQHEAYLPLLIDAYLVDGKTSEASRTIRAALNDASSSLSIDTLGQLASRAISANLPEADTLINAVEEAGAEPIEVAVLRAQQLGTRGEAAAGLAVLRSANATDPPPTDHLFRVFQYMAAYRLDGLEAQIETLAAREDLTPRMLLALLAIDPIWQERELVERLIARLAESLGPDSIRYRLAKANLDVVYADDPETIAQASNRINTIIERNPQSLSALLLMSNLLLQSDPPDLDGAIRFRKRAVDAYPENEALYPRLIGLLQQVGDFNEAQRYLTQLGNLRANSREVIRAETQLLERQGNFSEAVARLNSIMDEDAGVLDRLVQASLYLRAGDHAGVERVLADVLATDDLPPLVLQFAVSYRASRGEVARARQIIDDRRALLASDMYQLFLGMIAQYAGDLPSAEEHFQQATQENASHVEAWSALASHYLVRGDHPQAVEAALAGLEVAPENEGLRLIAASASLALAPDERARAIDTFEELLSENAALLDTVKLFHRLAQEGGSFATDADALRSTRQLTEKHPTFIAAWQLAVTTHVQAGQLDQARDLAQRASSRLRTHPQPARWLVEIAARRGAWEQASLAAQEWRARSLQNPYEPDLSIARLALIRGMPRSAVAALEPHVQRIVAVREARPGDFQLLIRALLRDGQIDRVARLTGDLPARDDGLFQLILESARVINPSYAQQALSHVQRVLPNHPDKLLPLAIAWGNVATRLNRDPAIFHRAEQIISTILQQPQHATKAMRAKAIVQSMRGDEAGAVATYEAILQREPNDPITLNNLAYALAEKLDRAHDAIDYIQQAIDAYPDVPQFVDTYAVVLMKLQRYDDAREAITRALDMVDGREPSFLLTQSRIELAAGNIAESERVFDRVLDLYNTIEFPSVELSESVESMRARLADAS